MALNIHVPKVKIFYNSPGPVLNMFLSKTDV